MRQGAIVARFVIGDSSVCVINCHLAAGQNAVRRRNVDAASILEEKMVFPVGDHSLAYTGGGDGTMVLDHELVFVSVFWEFVSSWYELTEVSVSSMETLIIELIIDVMPLLLLYAHTTFPRFTSTINFCERLNTIVVADYEDFLKECSRFPRRTNTIASRMNMIHLRSDERLLGVIGSCGDRERSRG